MEAVPGKRIHDTSLNFVKGQIKPTQDWIIVKPIEPELSKTVETHWTGEAVRGTVIAVGPGKYPNIFETGTKDGKPYKRVRQSTQFRPTEVKVGAIIQLGGHELKGYLWNHVMIDGEDHIICMEADIALIEDEMEANS